MDDDLRRQPDNDPALSHCQRSQVTSHPFSINWEQATKYFLCLIRTAKISIWLSGVAITVILSIVAYAGLIIYTRFRNLAKLVYILWLKCVGWQFFSFLESPATNRYLHCDPITSGLVSTKDQLLPLFVIDILGHLPGSVRLFVFFSWKKLVALSQNFYSPGFPGFFVAGVFSGALSTVSGG